MGCHSYIAQVWLDATYDIDTTWCMLRLNSLYSCLPWHDLNKIIVSCQYEVGQVETPKLKKKRLGWLQEIFSVSGRMGFFTWITQRFFEVA